MENFIGRRPVAAIVYSTGCPGRTPKTFAPLIRGCGAGGGVRISGSSPAWAVGSGAARGENAVAAMSRRRVYLGSVFIGCLC